ncbi:hypothetical protein OUZ56_004328 [Daphnia magna]|uniref:Uncharacterized protein n=1 Tax=Daphnia magna TaxID=35525 RepID=A0ABQ9YPF9_9CRUS|nr:hypothetical protein OUZ56_004328 [Daphnia magna]
MVRHTIPRPTKRRPTDNKRKPTELVGGGTTPVQMGPRDATTPPHAEHTGTKNQPVDPPIRGVFSNRGAHDQFAWKSMAFWLRRQLCHLTPDSVNQANRLSTVKG